MVKARGQFSPREINVTCKHYDNHVSTKGEITFLWGTT
jgi:hypothetical protein